MNNDVEKAADDGPESPGNDEDDWSRNRQHVRQQRYQGEMHAASIVYRLVQAAY